MSNGLSKTSTKPTPTAPIIKTPKNFTLLCWFGGEVGEGVSVKVRIVVGVGEEVGLTTGIGVDVGADLLIISTIKMEL